MKIVFETRSDQIDSLPKIQPASRFVPEWYKKISNYSHPNADCKLGKYNDRGNLVSNLSIKKCTPVRDAILSGYIIPLWADIAVHHNINQKITSFAWQAHPDQMEMDYHKREQFTETPIENFCLPDDNVWKFISPWYIKTPPGYSCMITSPFYHYADFEILPGIVDTDKHHIINYPFKFNGKEGQYTIPAGLPLVQITPFKRTDWESEIVPVSKSHIENYGRKITTKLVNFYKDFCHSKKNYR